MTTPRLRVDNLVKRFGGLTATDHLSLEVLPGEIHALIGPNGAGKTTLVAQIAGALPPDSGAILLDGRDITRLPEHRRAAAGLARSFQVTSLFPPFSARDNAMLAVQARVGGVRDLWRRFRGAAALDEPAMALLERVDLATRADDPVAGLSHGEKRRLEIALTLAGVPTVLLLDEPMAGLGPDDGVSMVRLLESLRGGPAVLLVEHDMDVVFRLADRISVLVYGQVIATGAPEEIRRDDRVRAAYLGTDDAPC